jgi:hypothetical protein
MLRTLLIAAVMLSLAGCGTICNMAGGIRNPESEPKVYGGVQRDLIIIGDLLSSAKGPLTQSSDRGVLYFLAVGSAICVVDPVLSLFGDTLTLPITVPLQDKRLADDQRKRSDPIPAESADRTVVAPRVEALPEVQVVPNAADDLRFPH